MPPTRSKGRLIWTAGAAAAIALLLIGGSWFLLDSTVPAADYDEVVADLRAAEADLARTRAEFEVLAGELRELEAQTAQPDAEAGEPDAEPSDLGGGFVLGSDEDMAEWIEEEEQLRARYYQARWRLLEMRADGSSDDQFDLLRDSLCLWFTPQVMNDIVVVAQYESGTRFDFDGFGQSDCSHKPGISAQWYVSRAVDGLEDSRLAIEFGRVAADHRQLPIHVEPDDFTSILSTGWGWGSSSSTTTPNGSVAYGNLSYHRSFDQGVSVQLRVAGHEDDVLFFDLGVYQRELNDQGYPNRYEWFAFEVIHLMLDHMGWIECSMAGCS